MAAVADVIPGTVDPKQRFATVPGVEVLCVGTHKGEAYTRDDLDQMVKNFSEGVVDATLAVGHEENQDLLKNTGYPAAGKITNLRRDGDFLVADFSEVPPLFAQLINGGAYRKVSSEVYSDFVDNTGQHHGKTLRRVSLLGAQVPEIKSLADLPLANYGLAGHDGAATPAIGRGRESLLKFSEITDTKTSGIVRVLCEVVAMKKKLTPAKTYVIPVSKFSDRAKQGLQKFAEEPSDTAQGAPPPAGVDRAQMIDMLAQMGFDTSTITDAIPDPFLAEMIRVWQSGEGSQEGTQMSASPPIQPSPPFSPNPPASQPSALLPTTPATQVTMKFSEEVQAAINTAVQSALAPINAQLERARADVATFQGQTKRDLIDRFCEDMLKAGKILPAELDSSNAGGGLRAQLLRADAIQKFAEGDTELDRQMELIKKRPNIVKFAEQVKVGKGPGSKLGDDSDPEVQEVVAFAEANVSDLAKGRQTVESFVGSFKKRRASDPEYTASKFLKGA